MLINSKTKFFFICSCVARGNLLSNGNKIVTVNLKSPGSVIPVAPTCPYLPLLATTCPYLPLRSTAQHGTLPCPFGASRGIARHCTAGHGKGVDWHEVSSLGLSYPFKPRYNKGNAKKQANRNIKTILRAKATFSGEIFKEPFIDIFHTNFEQVAFSLTFPRGGTGSCQSTIGKVRVLGGEIPKIGTTPLHTRTLPIVDWHEPMPLLAPSHPFLPLIAFSCPFGARQVGARHGTTLCPYLPLLAPTCPYKARHGTALHGTSCHGKLRHRFLQKQVNKSRENEKQKKSVQFFSFRKSFCSTLYKSSFCGACPKFNMLCKKRFVHGVRFANKTMCKYNSCLSGLYKVEQKNLHHSIALTFPCPFLPPLAPSSPFLPLRGRARHGTARKGKKGEEGTGGFATKIDHSGAVMHVLNKKIGDFLSSGDKIGHLLANSYLPCLPPSRRTYKTEFCMHSTLPLQGIAGHDTEKVKTQHNTAQPKGSKKGKNKKCCKNGYTWQKISRNKGCMPMVLNSSGRVITISKTQLVIQKTQNVLFYNSANLHIKKGEWVNEGSPILTLTHQTLITGDIVQGIPRIEQLFEAFTSPPSTFRDRRVEKFKDVHDTLHSQVRDIFRKHWLKSVLPIAVRKSLEEIQYILVESIQKVYLSQGVLIADKHIEIVIRQIASRGQILDSGSTGLFLEEILPIRHIENANLTTPGKKCLYVPAVVGLTAAALTSDSFISAASFQETTRVLSRDAVVGKSDFLRGLKEKVVIGDLISAGTGLDIYFIYTTMLAR